jgi:hypothetical protein
MKMLHTVLLVAGLLCSAQAAYAVDGVILFDQARALAGNVTPGDDPGFPVTLSRPGSYRLSGNLTAPQGGTGILIAANDVTLDLNGFTLAANVHGDFGIFDALQAHARVTIRNGSITSFALPVGLSSIDHLDLRDMRLQSDAIGSDVVFAGAGSIVMNNTIDGGDFGLTAGRNAIISGNVVKNAGKVGITAFCPSTVTGNTVESFEIAFNFVGDRAKCVLVNNSIQSATGGN